MQEHPGLSDPSSADGLPVAPSLDVTLQSVRAAVPSGGRMLRTSLLAVGLGLAAALVARALTALIGGVTNLAFFGRLSTAFVSPAGHHLGFLMVLVPVAGGIVVGVMARYGSQAIRGHGIPEAMEQVLVNESRVPPRVTFLKPLSAAIAIGTGGPFGAEGPIIATGGALGSLLGQLLHTTAAERKTLLAAGAAAGMAATFGSPVSAVLLAVELLLFELRPRSLVPVAAASVAATGLRDVLVGPGAVFAMRTIAAPSAAALGGYVLLGALAGLAGIGITRLVYRIEDGFERLPIHWMWWPALGGIAVGVVGLLAPRTLGVGYDNIEDVLTGRIAGSALAVLATMKLVSWSISLGSGTSGGTLAPLFTIGGGLGAVLGGLAHAALPAAGIDPRLAGLVGMAAVFAGASRALLASVVFALEVTGQPACLAPLLGGCGAAYLVSCLLMKHTIMTEKIERRGVRVPADYSADFLDQVPVRDALSAVVATLPATRRLESVRAWFRSGDPDAQHQGYPVLDEAGCVIGVVTRRDLLDPSLAGDRPVSEAVKRPPIVIEAGRSLREAADHMLRADVGRLVVVSGSEPPRMIGILTRGDLLSAHGRRLREDHDAVRVLGRRPPVARSG